MGTLRLPDRQPFRTTVYDLDIIEKGSGSGVTLFVALRSLVYGTAFVLFWGWLALGLRPLDSRLALELPVASRLVGTLLMVVGGSLALSCVSWFVLVGRGTPAPFDPPRVFVAHGPYRWVRNPMYIGGLAVLLGFGLWHRSPLMALFTLAVWGLVHGFVVWIEERGLERRFGGSYREYKQAVNRWVPKMP